MTEIITGEGKLYLATVIDLLSRRLLGYAMGACHEAELVVASLNMAAATRGGDVRGVIHPHRGPAEDRDLDHRLLQHPTATRRMQVPEPDRLRTKPPGQPCRGVGRSKDLHGTRGLTSAGSPERAPHSTR
ncbi:DDE-type integrase/transposase/recombinase [Streptomyces sp. NPDC002776]